MKKTLAFIIALTMVLAAIPALAAALTLEDAIAKAKTTFTIEASLSQFSSSSYSDSENGVTVWDLSWNEPKGGAYVSVMVDSLGIIRSYSRYDDNDYKRVYSSLKQIPTLSRDAAIEAAAAWLPKLLGDKAASFDVKDAQCELNDNYYSVSFPHIENGITVDASNVYLNIDADTAALRYYSLNANFSLTYPAPGAIKSVEEAEKVLGEKAVKLVYMTFIKEKTISVLPVYEIESYEYYDANTLERIIPEYRFFGRNSALNSVKAEDAGAGGYVPTPEEQEEITNVSNLITTDEAGDALEKMTELDMANVKFTSDRYYSQKPYYDNEKETRYFATLNYESTDADKYAYVSATLNAKDGTLTDFSAYYDSEKADKLISIADAQKAAEAFIAKYKADKAARVKLCEGKNDEKSNEALFCFEEYVNSIPFPHNSMAVTVNRVNGKISGYSENFEENLTFPSTENIISAADAAKIAKETATVTLRYISSFEDDKEKMLLVYSYGGEGASLIAAADGKLLNYDGEEFKKAQAPALPSDIEGQPCEAAVKALHSVGVYLDVKTLNAAQAITQGELLELIALCREYSYARDAEGAFDACVSEGIIEESEKNLTASVRRDKAVQLVINTLGAKKISQLASIYKTSYSDEGAIAPECVGAVAIASGMGIIDADDAFRPTDALTRGEAFIMLYNMLKNASLIYGK